MVAPLLVASVWSSLSCGHPDQLDLLIGGALPIEPRLGWQFDSIRMFLIALVLFSQYLLEPSTFSASGFLMVTFLS